MKRFLLTATALMLVLSVGLSVIAYARNEKEHKLTCNSNGDFTILVVSDPQCDTAEQWEEARLELETLVQRANPDFVLINGDMNSRNQIPADMWEAFVSPLTQRGIYWSTTNGNHDPFKYEYYQMYKGYDECLNSTVSVLDGNYDFTRPMNYVLPIYSNDGKEIVFAVYGMDSGAVDGDGYEGVTQKQINWYIDQSNRLKELNAGKKVTSLLCMHIPLVQTLDMYYSSPQGEAVSGEGSGGLYKVYGIANEPNFDNKEYTCENGTTVSKLKIHTTAEENDTGIFDEILNQGDIKAIFFGHDHRTNIAGSYKGVILGFAGKLSTGCYSDKLCRGGRVLRFNQSDPEKFTVEWLAALESSTDQPPIYSDGMLAK